MHKTIVLVAVLAAAAVAAGQDRPKAPAKADVDAIQGSWVASAAEVNGGPMGADSLKLVRLRVEGDKYTWQINELGPERGTLKLAPEKKPKALDLRCKEGNNQDRTLPAIYRLDGQTLTVCYELGDGERPKDFKAPAGTMRLAVTYRREKP